MKRWEYYTDEPDRGQEESVCNDLGNQGWELACITVTGLYVFKRELIEHNEGTTDAKLLIEEPRYPSH